MAGPITAGVQAGIANYQQSVRLKQFQKLADRQELLQQASLLKDVVGMPAGPVRGLAIKKVLGPFFAHDPDTLTALSKMNDEEAQSLGEMMNNLLVDHPELGRQGLQALVKSGKVGIPELWSLGQKSAAAKREAKLHESFAPDGGGAQIAQGPQPNAAAPEDFTLRTGPAGEALGMTPDAPPPPPPPPAMGAPPAPPPQPTGALTPEQQIERLTLAEDKLLQQVRTAMPLGGLTEDLKRGVDAQLGAIHKRREILLKAMETKETGPLTDAGKLLADRRALVKMGQGESSPALKAIDRQIEALGRDKDTDTAESPIGKMVEDLERAKRIYGPQSPQAAAVADALVQARRGDGKSGDAKLTDVAGLRKEFTSLTSDFRQVKDALGRINASAANPSQAGDLAILVGYMKLIDPRTGVREGELATAQNAASIPQRVIGLYNRLLTENGRLSDSMRKDFVGKAQEAYLSHERTQRAMERQFRGIAERNGFNPADVVLDFVDAPGAQPAPGAAAGDLPAAKANVEKSRQDALKATERLRNLLKGAGR